MQNVTSTFKQKLYKNERNYITTLYIRLEDGTQLTITNDRIMDGGFETDDAVSDDNSFSALGATIISSLNVVIYNNDQTYSDYNFANAKVDARIGLQTGEEIVNGNAVPVIETVRKGIYTVADATYGEATISLSCLDNMGKFDQPYSLSKLSYPATLLQIVQNACTICGVQLYLPANLFPNSSVLINTRPDNETTFREVIGWVATLACCFAKCDTQGRLILSWFDTTATLTDDDIDGGVFNPWYSSGSLNNSDTLRLWSADVDNSGISLYTNTDEIYNKSLSLVSPIGEYSLYTEGIINNALHLYTASGAGRQLLYASADDTIDGGVFNPWADIDSIDGGTFTNLPNAHYINSLYAQNIGVDDVIITGIRATTEIADRNSSENTITYVCGTIDYCIDIKDNKFITEDNIQSVCNWLGSQLIGLRFRPCNITQPSDPSVEAGDVAFLWDSKGIEHAILITRATFSPTSPQRIVCGAEAPAHNSATRFSLQTKAYVDARKQIQQQKTDYDLSLEELANRVNNASGLYETKVRQEDGSYITYLHNKPNSSEDSFEFPSESDIIIKISNVGVTVTSTGNTANPVWYGLEVNGDLLANILRARGISGDWVSTGTIRSQDGSVAINLDDNRIEINGITSFTNFVTRDDLSISGRTEINGSNITTGTIKDPNSNTVINLTTGAITIKKGTINLGNGNFVVTDTGRLSCTGATVTGTIRSEASDTGFWTKLDAGYMQGGMNYYSASTPGGYIAFNTHNAETNVPGIRVAGRGVITFLAPSIIIADWIGVSTDVVGYYGRTKTFTFMTGLNAPVINVSLSKETLTDIARCDSNGVIYSRYPTIERITNVTVSISHSGNTQSIVFNKGFMITA